MFQNPAVNAQVGLLSSGLEGSTILAVFSSASIAGAATFLFERTVAASAILFSEAQEGEASSRQFSSTPHVRSNANKTCPRTPLSKIKRRVQPALNILSKITRPVSKAKSQVYQKLGLSCLFPKLLRPFESIIEKVTCKLGLDEDQEEVNGFIKIKNTNCSSCLDPSSEMKPVTRSLGVNEMESIDEILENQVSTYDDCFDDMRKVKYGARVLAKLVDDVPCEDPRYEGICEELMTQGRVLNEEDCQSIG